MNKMVKGSLAGATGVMLLMSGFGTYALWSDSAGMNNATVNSGELDIAAGVVEWNDLATLGVNDWTPATDKMVPGDVVTRTQVFDLKGTGKNLTGTVDFAAGAINTGGFGALMDIQVDVTSNDVVVAETGTSNDYTFAGPFDTAQLTAVVTYRFDPDNLTTAQEAQNATASLAASTFTIAQN